VVQYRQPFYLKIDNLRSETMPYKLYIDGQWQDSESGKRIKINNPATGEIVASIAYGSRIDAEKALDSAEEAFLGWKSMTAYERGELLNRAAENIRERAQDIARVLTEENGKPISESLAEARGCASWFNWFAEEGKRVYGRMIPSHYNHKRHWVLRQPVGVVAAIAPWNFPIALMCRKLAAALAAGCVVVSRPSSRTPLSTALIFECLHEAGFPAGTISFIVGSARELTNAMLDHQAVRKIAFTGSTEVGKELMAQAGDRITKVSLELGGHAPLIVFPDVDLEDAVEKTVVGKFRNAGQSCIAPTRIYVHEDIFDSFTERAVERTSKIVVGNGLQEGVEMGPLFDQGQLDNIEAFLADAVAKGAEVLIGGERLVGEDYDKGLFFAPTIVKNVTGIMRLSCEEIFGPILPLIRFSSEEEVIREANATEFGLASYVLVKDISVAIRVSEALEFGIVGLNDTVPTVPQAPFGGWKESGIGREGGIEGIDAYLETKYVSVGNL
jgi:succinate-semialdehyde dehydrogenase/glutarate-semialdehyde dehydrogenase